MKIRVWQFLTNRYYVNSQNTIISLDFWTEIYLILYPSLEYLTTHFIIVSVRKNQSMKEGFWLLDLFFRTDMMREADFVSSCLFILIMELISILCKFSARKWSSQIKLWKGDSAQLEIINESIICHNDELSSTMSWVDLLLKDSELFILFAENSQILLKISGIPILFTFMHLVAHNRLINNQLNSSSNSTYHCGR